MNMNDMIMDNSSLHLPPETAHWEPKYPFDLVVSYEDTATRNHAMALYDHLAQSLLDDYDFQCSWFRFDHFRSAEIRAQACDAAAEANMIIVCLRSGETVPTLVRQWIESWLPRKDDRKSALVSLVGGVEHQQRDNCPANVYLQKVARVCKMDYFSHSYNASKLPSLRVDAAPANMKTAVGSFFQIRTESPRWGINE